MKFYIKYFRNDIEITKEEFEEILNSIKENNKKQMELGG